MLVFIVRPLRGIDWRLDQYIVDTGHFICFVGLLHLEAAAMPTTRIGVLALQGSYREHMSMLQRVPDVDVIEVRTKEELESVSGLIIPGGESTTMALVAERWGLIPELQTFAKAGKPVWGTCAGMIFLAERAEGEHTM